MLINTSYFQNKAVYIPNSVAQPSIGSNTPTAIGNLSQELESRECELLVKALGWGQYADLLNELEELTPDVWTVKPSAAQKWKYLVDGVTYDGKRWQGLRFTIGGQKISLIAYYVYFYYIQSDWYQYSTTGIQVAEAENSTRQMPNAQQAKAWNVFSHMYGGSREGRLNYSIFSSHNGMGIRWGFGTTEKSTVSLWRFLNDHNEDFDVSYFQSFPEMGIVNAYNL